MALTVKQLNADASFLLSFQPVIPSPREPYLPDPKPFTILLDPWLTGPSTLLHPKISFVRLHSPPCIAELGDLPEPDLVVISQHRSDHCNEPTLRQLSGRGSHSKTVILAGASAARTIRGWNHFESNQIQTLERWEKTRSQQKVARIPVPPVVQGGSPGEVTVAFIAQRRDITGLHGAIGITYRPPGLTPSQDPKLSTVVTRAQPQSPTEAAMTPPATPNSHPPPPSTLSSSNTGSSLGGIPTLGPRGIGCLNRPNSNLRISQVDASNDQEKMGNLVAPIPASSSDSPPTMPRSTLTSPLPISSPASLSAHLHVPPTPSSLRVGRSRSTIMSPIPGPLPNYPTATASASVKLPATPPKSPTQLTTPFSARTLSTLRNLASLHEAQAPELNRPVSVIFSPHGTCARSLQDFTRHHLTPQAAVPVTLLMHCFERQKNPWFLGGEISLGAQSGALAAAKLGVRCWVSTHDGEKEIKGLATRILRTKRWDIDEIEGTVAGLERALERERREDTSRSGARGRKCHRNAFPVITARQRWWEKGAKSPGADYFTGARKARKEYKDGEDDGGIKPRLRMRVMALDVGEEVILTSEGVWDAGSISRSGLNFDFSRE